jgi:hypothetical protein
MRVVQGDSDGARCLVQPYRLLQLPEEVVVEVCLPRWVVPQEDLQVVKEKGGVGCEGRGNWQWRLSVWCCAVLVVDRGRKRAGADMVKAVLLGLPLQYRLQANHPPPRIH